MKRSTSLQDLGRDNGSDDSGSGMRRVRSQQDMGQIGRQSGTSTPNTPPAGARVPMLSEKELRDHFNMPLNEVAKKFGMCTTALKKLCRKYGVMQWPHRKLRSLEKKIASLRAEQRYTSDGGGSLDEEIRKFEMQREALVSGNGADFDDQDWGVADSPERNSETFLESSDAFHGNELPPAAYKHKPDKTRTLAKHSGSGGSWDAGGSGGAKLHEKQLHLQQLEDENSKLRELSRSLMKERQDLVNNLNSSHSEMESLRILCGQLTQQLNMNNHSGQTIKSEDGGGTYSQNASNRGSASTAGFASHQVHSSTGWGVQQSPGMSALRQSPGMSPGVWAATAEAPPLIPGGIDQRGGGHDDGMHSLSWMAPEFELDDLL